jgi:hypothetical protein
MFDYNFDPLLRVLSPLGHINRLIKKCQKLFQRRIVHPINKRDLDHRKVNRSPSNSNRPILLPLLIDLISLDLRVFQFDGYFLGLSLSVIEDVHEVFVV